MPDTRLRAYFDGGCRPNPGRIEIATVIAGVAIVIGDAGHGDNNDAEWLALIAAARRAQDEGAVAVTFVGDSALVVAQAMSAAPCRDARFRDHLDAFRAAAATFVEWRVRLVPRARNLAGIALAARHPR